MTKSKPEGGDRAPAEGSPDLPPPTDQSPHEWAGGVENATGSHEQIRKRAYEIWQAEGCPSGKAHEHWKQAEQELGKA